MRCRGKAAKKEKTEMKKLVALVCSLVLLVSGMALFAGCNEIGIPDEEGYTIKIGYTEYEPMNYYDDDGNFVGFDTEFAIKLCTDLGYKYEFVLLNNWATKVVDLNGGTIDLIWNGMTITPDLQESILISTPYLTNQQVLIAKSDVLSQYSTLEDLLNATVIAVETGSAAETLVKAIEGMPESKVRPVQSQARALMEVGSNQADVAVIDYTMAISMTGEGTNYTDVGWKDVGFEEEQYGIGARKSDAAFMEKLNAKIAEYQESGYLTELYNKYPVTEEEGTTNS